MASNNPPTATPQQEEQIILVRGSEEYKEYMRHQGGWLKMLVAQFEGNLATAGRVLLLLFLIYTTVKTGLDRMGVATPIWLEIAMLALQVGGVEGAVPGLSRQKEELTAQKKLAEAKEIGGAITSTRWLALLTGAEIGLEEVAAKYPTNWLSWIVLIYSIILLLARLWLITKFLIAMARIEHKGPKIISKAEHARLQAEKEQEQIRMDNAAIQVSIGEALANWTKQQDQVLADRSTLLAQQLHGQLVQLFGGQLAALTSEQERVVLALQQVQSVSSAVPAIDNQAIIASVLAQFETRFAVAMKRLEGEVKQQVLVSLASETSQVKQGGETLVGPRLVSLPQRSVASSRTVKQPASETAEADQATGGSGEVIDYRAILYPLMDQDNRRQVADLMQLTGLPKTVRTTVWRWWNRYHEEHGTRGLAQIAAGSIESQPDTETA